MQNVGLLFPLPSDGVRVRVLFFFCEALAQTSRRITLTPALSHPMGEGEEVLPNLKSQI
jgi:hypothetical protein